MKQENWSKEKERYKEKDNLNDKPNIDQMRDMIKIIIGEMDNLHSKIKLLEN